MKTIRLYALMGALIFLTTASLPLWAASDTFREEIYHMGTLKPVDSVPKLKVGDHAPGFTLMSTSGSPVSLKDYAGKKNVVISFVPAAWTQVCSDQWPGYNIAQEEFESLDATLIGITVDNVPTLYAWTRAMGTLWFPVLSDFWPHGKVAEAYGVLRSNGTSERAIFIIDKKGVIRFIDVHDINRRPPLEDILNALEKLNR
ncbi:MAG TPA: peroxiredoxin [Deltaproteobacteria bacterium]|nr:peroxiredoxin [Deltaproteobacteria bacterium]HOI07684.1 peroxiredoxin [Deltaproteobacteria bacterium]